MRILLGKMLALVLSALLPTISALAEDAPQATPSSEIDGFNFNFVYTGEFATSSGGLLSGDAYLDNIDMTLETDLESLLGWSNSKLMIYVLGNQGRSPSAFIGDTQGVSNIDAPDTWKLYELWYQRTWVQDKYSIRAGLYDYNSEFDVLETAGLFLNSSFGIGPDIAQSGENGPSIFPTTSLALRGRFTTDRNFYLQGVILDGVPGDPLNSHGTHIKLNSEDGLMLALEAGKILDEGAYKKIAVGSWRYSKNSVESAAGVAISGQKNWGIYALAEARLFNENDVLQGLSGFVRYGIANSDINQLDSYLGIGAVYTGWFPKRNQDQLGIAIANAFSSDQYRAESAIAGSKSEGRESTIEITYRAQLTKWLAVQADYQHVINPGLEGTVANANVFLFRFEIGF